MDILQYLIELLKTRKQIGVEGLGTFYKKKTPGRYDAETHSFLPPSYTLEFTSDLLENTNLATYIQAKRSISEDSAKYFITQFVEETQKRLQQQGEFNLDNFGSFKLAHNQLTFNPSQNINTGFDFFALPAVTAEVKQPQQEAAEEAPSTPVAENPTQLIEEPHVEQVQVPEFEHEMSKLTPVESEVTEEPSIKEEQAREEQEIIEVTPVEVYEPEEELDKVTDEPAEVEKEAEISQPKELEETEVAPIESKAEAPVTENEPTDSEVFEEITEVNTENPTQQQDTTTEDALSTVTPTTIETDSIKLRTINHQWDFDKIDNSKNTGENTSVNEFNDNQVAQEFEEEKSGMPLYLKIIIALLILLVLAVGTLYFLKPDVFENFKRGSTNQDKKVTVPIQRSDLKTQQDSISFADSIMKNAEKVGLDVQPAKDTIKVTTSKTEVKPTLTYDIIIASFATAAKANEYVDRMKKKGFDAKISTMPGKRKNISIATYNHPDSAEKHLAKFRKQFNNKEIYAQPIKNK